MKSSADNAGVNETKKGKNGMYNLMAKFGLKPQIAFFCFYDWEKIKKKWVIRLDYKKGKEEENACVDYIN